VKLEEKTGQGEDAINWQVVFYLKNVHVGRFAKMYKVNKKKNWPPMQSAMDVVTWEKEGGGGPLEVWMAASSTAVSTCVHT